MPNILKTIADNPALFQAVKDTVLKHFSLDHMKDDLPNEMLGQFVRSRLEGRQKVEAAFLEIATYKTPQVHKEEINRAR